MKLILSLLSLVITIFCFCSLMAQAPEWEKINNPYNESMLNFSIGPDNNILCLINPLGVYYSNDKGSTWEYIDSSFNKNEKLLVGRNERLYIWPFKTMSFAVFDYKNKRWHISNFTQEVLKLDENDKGDVLFSTIEGVFLYFPEMDSVRKIYNFDTPHYINNNSGAYFTKDGDILASNGKFFIYSANKGSNWDTLNYPAQAFYKGKTGDIFRLSDTLDIFNNDTRNFEKLMPIDQKYFTNMISWLVDYNYVPYVANNSGHIFCSRDTGKTWTKLNYFNKRDYVNKIDIDTNNQIYYSSEIEGLNYSDDGGETWKHVSVKTAKSDLVKIVKRDNGQFIGLNSISQAFFSVDSCKTWRPYSKPLNEFPLQLQLNSNGDAYLITNNGLYLCLSGSTLFNPITMGLDYRVTSLAFLDSLRIFAGTTNGLYYSTYAGSNWTKCYFDESDYSPMINSIVADREKDTIYSASVKGFLLTDTTDLDLNRVHSTLDSGYLNFVAIDNNNNIYVSKAGIIFRSSDNGKTWNLFKSFEGETVIKQMSISPDSFIYVLTGNYKIYQNKIGKENWIDFSAQLGTNNISSFNFDNAGYFYVCTDSGVFRTINPVVTEAETMLQEQNSIFEVTPNPAHENVNINVKINEPSYIKISLFDILGNELGIIKSGDLDAGNWNFGYNLSAHPAGVYFIKIENNGQTESRMIIKN